MGLRGDCLRWCYCRVKSQARHDLFAPPSIDPPNLLAPCTMAVVVGRKRQRPPVDVYGQPLEPGARVVVDGQIWEVDAPMFGAEYISLRVPAPTPSEGGATSDCAGADLAHVQQWPCTQGPTAAQSDDEEDCELQPQLHAMVRVEEAVCVAIHDEHVQPNGKRRWPTVSAQHAARPLLAAERYHMGPSTLRPCHMQAALAPASPAEHAHDGVPACSQAFLWQQQQQHVEQPETGLL